MSSPRSRTPRGSRDDSRGPRTPRSREEAINSHRESIRRAIRQQYGVDEGTPSPPRRRTPASRRLAFDDDEPRSALELLAAAPLRREDDALRTSRTQIAAPPLRQNDALTTSATSVRSGPVWRFEPAPGGKAAWRRRRGLLVVERGRARLNIADGQTVIESYTVAAVAPADELEVAGEVFYCAHGNQSVCERAENDTSPSLRASPETDTSGEVDALWPGAEPVDGDARRAQFARGLVTYDDASDVDHDLIRHGKKGELRRMRDEYAALKRDLADKKSRR